MRQLASTRRRAGGIGCLADMAALARVRAERGHVREVLRSTPPAVLLACRRTPVESQAATRSAAAAATRWQHAADQQRPSLALAARLLAASAQRLIAEEARDRCACEPDRQSAGTQWPLDPSLERCVLPQERSEASNAAAVLYPTPCAAPGGLQELASQLTAHAPRSTPAGTGGLQEQRTLDSAESGESMNSSSCRLLCAHSPRAAIMRACAAQRAARPRGEGRRRRSSHRAR
ncbi:hypothetical protein FA09DRAFT_202089 [Tilletiopsis washingtonensis]|jgi:hypothetical protein|uniref:Uncharacterized protein n=1 Tax=Tilletiopsis washingtonensis TaxID=58919 RepID=A0A316ZFK1_9BASI|nr:hypothetical protein FA09DRAFT_202089 [Tilletiopsis washingtonensis]PWO00017.1 hypothetical protein FA09DRAFT_202089 [Tilletiopsis washingtonensis]